MNNWYRVATLLAIILALGACGAGADRDAWRNAGKQPTVGIWDRDTSTWDNATWGE